MGIVHSEAVLYRENLVQVCIIFMLFAPNAGRVKLVPVFFYRYVYVYGSLNSASNAHSNHTLLCIYWKVNTNYNYLQYCVIYHNTLISGCCHPPLCLNWHIYITHIY